MYSYHASVFLLLKYPNGPNSHISTFLSTQLKPPPLLTKKLLSDLKKGGGSHCGPGVSRRDTIFLNVTMTHNSHHGLWKVKASKYFLATERKYALQSELDRVQQYIYASVYPLFRAI